MAAGGGRAPEPERSPWPANQLIGNAGYTALFGDGAVKFRADRWIVTDADGATDLGAVSYREGKDNVLFVLPQRGVQLPPLKLETADRFSLLGEHPVRWRAPMRQPDHDVHIGWLRATMPPAGVWAMRCPGRHETMQPDSDGQRRGEQAIASESGR